MAKKPKPFIPEGEFIIKALVDSKLIALNDIICYVNRFTNYYTLGITPDMDSFEEWLSISEIEEESKQTQDYINNHPEYVISIGIAKSIVDSYKQILKDN